MKKTIAISAAALALLTSGVAVFAADAIADRQKIMKAAGGALYRDIGKTVKGDQPFDLAKIQADLDVLADAAQKMPALFPADSQKGDTKAMMTVWENKADFDARWQALGKVVAEAKAQVKDLDSLKAAQPKLLQSCDSCHKEYRARSS